MTFLSLVLSLLLEQWRALPRENPPARWFLDYCAYLRRQFDGGEARHGIVAWFAAVAPVAAAVLVIHHLAWQLSPLLALAWNVAVLYATMGVRRFSHNFTVIAEALRRGDLEGARGALRAWHGDQARSAGETARLAIEQGLADGHRHVFAVVFWFAVLPGPLGAVVYRMAVLLREAWAKPESGESAAFGEFAARALRVVDWLPARATALSFAAMGDFEDAMFCWRTQAQSWADETLGIVLASGAGAMGVRLGESLERDGTLVYRPELGIGDEPDPDAMDGAVRLFWRVMALWLFLALVTGIAAAASG